MKTYVIEIDFFNTPKNEQIVAGDTLLLNRTKDNRIVATLADGLGSGIKANVLSQITAAMCQRFMMANYDYLQTAQTIVEILPICSKRKISYSTFTTINIDESGSTSILEYDNPDYLLLRDLQFIQVPKKSFKIKTAHTRNTIYHSNVDMEVGDRLVFFSDGVVQSGMGTRLSPLGWEIENVKNYIIDLVREDPQISARILSKKIVEKALKNDGKIAHDDITCAVVYYRKSRELLLLTGPPSNSDKDRYIVERFKSFDGVKIISGGTTSKIISRALNETIQVDLNDIYSNIPPSSKMKSADIVTEGLHTINKVLKLLEGEVADRIKGNDAAYKVCNMLLNSDIIHLLVGTSINPAHQNPNMPVEMGLRRLSVNKMVRLLRDKFLKTVEIEYL